MPFQIKDFASIVAAQINHARSVTSKITDFQPGSVARTIMEAPAVEMEELYLQMFLGLREAIPVATFLSFGFDLLPPAQARGFVTVSKTPAPSTNSTIPAGTVFSTTDGRTYTSTADVVWAAGVNVVRIPVAADSAGASGNAAAGAITTSPSFGDGYTIGNSTIETGRDTETEAERETRFAEFVRSLSRGTVHACLYAASQAVVSDETGNRTEYVTRYGYDEVPGLMRIFAYSSAGVPSAALLADGQRRLDGWRDETTGVATPGYRPAGVDVEMLPMVERAITLSIRVAMTSGFSLTADVERRLNDIFVSAITGVQAGETLFLNTLIELMLVVPGVRQIIPSSTENIVCDVSEALIPGALSVSAL